MSTMPQIPVLLTLLNHTYISLLNSTLPVYIHTGGCVLIGFCAILLGGGYHSVTSQVCYSVTSFQISSFPNQMTGLIILYISAENFTCGGHRHKLGDEWAGIIGVMSGGLI